MRVLQMAFQTDSKNTDLPHNYVPNSIVYTGTHDNDTSVGWFNSKVGTGSTRDAGQIAQERAFCLKYLKSNGKEINWDFIETIFASVSCMSILPLQDVLGLGSESRMNLPASHEGNWVWRYKAEDITDGQSKRLRDLVELYDRSAAFMPQPASRPSTERVETRSTSERVEVRPDPRYKLEL